MCACLRHCPAFSEASGEQDAMADELGVQPDRLSRMEQAPLGIAADILGQRQGPLGEIHGAVAWAEAECELGVSA
jgi:hypothetical protein